MGGLERVPEDRQPVRDSFKVLLSFRSFRGASRTSTRLSMNAITALMPPVTSAADIVRIGASLGSEEQDICFCYRMSSSLSRCYILYYCSSLCRSLVTDIRMQSSGS